MKNIFLLPILLLMTITGITQNLVNKIPADAGLVATFNLARLNEMVPLAQWDSLLAKPFKEMAMEDSSLQIQSVSQLGINLNSTAYYYHRENDSLHYNMLIANMQDAASLEKLLGPAKIAALPGGMRKFAFEDSSSFMMWNNNQVALVVVMLKDGYFKDERVAKNHGLSWHENAWKQQVTVDTATTLDMDTTTMIIEDTVVIAYDEPSSDTVAVMEETYEPDESDFDFYNDRHIKKRISAACANAALKDFFAGNISENIASNASFNKAVRQDAAISVWIDKPMQQYFNLMPSYATGAYPSYYSSGSSDETFGNKSLSSHLVLDAKQASIDLQIELTPEMASLQQKIYGRKLNKRFLDYVNADSTLGYMSWAMDTKAYLDKFPALIQQTYGRMRLGLGGDEFALLGELFSFLFDEKAISDLVKGDGMVIFDGLYSTETTYTDYIYDENFNATPQTKTKTETLPKFMVMMSSKQNRFVQKLIDYGMKRETVMQKQGYYEMKIPGSPMQFYFTYKNDIFFFTNAEENMLKVNSGGAKGNLSKAEKKMLRNNNVNLYVNPSVIGNKLASTEVGATETLIEVTNALQKMGPVRMIHYPVKNNVASAKMWMEIPAGNENALAFFMNLFKQFK